MFGYVKQHRSSRKDQMDQRQPNKEITGRTPVNARNTVAHTIIVRTVSVRVFDSPSPHLLKPAPMHTAHPRPMARYELSFLPVGREGGMLYNSSTFCRLRENNNRAKG